MSVSLWRIRPEMDTDVEAIDALVTDAFQRDDEARLIQLLRSQQQVAFSLVAEQHHPERLLIGHLLASPVSIEQQSNSNGSLAHSTGVGGTFLGLAPLSVLTCKQKQGVGQALMQAGISWARDHGVAALFLLGNPNYYQRFEFTQSHLANEYGATQSFMHLELVSGALTSVQGCVRYANAFSQSGV